MNRKANSTRLDSLAAAAGAFLLFAGSLFNGFTNWDDYLYITENRVIQEFSAQSLAKIFFSFQLLLYHPLTLFAYMAQYQVWGLHPLGYHLTSALLHALNTCLAFYFLSGLFPGRRGLCFFGVFFFAAHPLRVEAISWASGQKEPLFAAFYLGAALCYRAWRKDGSAMRYGGSLFLGLCALMAKPSAVSLPAILWLEHLLLPNPANQQPLQQLNQQPSVCFSNNQGQAPPAALPRLAHRILHASLAVMPFAALSFLFAYLAIQARKSEGAIHLIQIPPFAHNVLVSCQAVWFYLWKTLWPLNLSPFYPSPPVPLPWNTMNLAALAGLAALTILALAAARKAPLLCFGWFFWLISLAPVAGILPVGAFFAADRFTYLPSLGLIIALMFLIQQALERRNSSGGPADSLRWIPRFSGVCVIGAIALLSFMQQAVWYDSLSLWSSAARAMPTNERVLGNLSEALMNAGNFKRAEEIARLLTVEHSRQVRPWLLLGSALLLENRPVEAREVFRRAAQTPTPLLAEQKAAMYKLGRTEALLGRTSEALVILRQAQLLDPRDLEIRKACQELENPVSQPPESSK